MKIKLVSSLVALSLSFPVMANGVLTPYVGADVKWNNTRFKKTEGGNALQKNYPEGNLFGGIKFNEWVGLEVGYESTSRQSRKATIGVDDTFFGDPVASVSTLPLSIKTKTKISGYHANVVGFYPIAEEYCLSLFGSIGLARLKIKSHLELSIPPDPDILNFTFTKEKVVPRVTVGVQHMLNECIGVRAMLAWERTSAFKRIYAENSPLYMTPRDSKSIGIGAFYSF